MAKYKFSSSLKLEIYDKTQSHNFNNIAKCKFHKKGGAKMNRFALEKIPQILTFIDHNIQQYL